MCMIQQRELAESISKVLYPEDNHIAGRLLRFKQYYFSCFCHDAEHGARP